MVSLLLSCQNERPSCEPPELSLVVERLANCLSEDADVAAAKNLLAQWGFEHDVITANLLPASLTPELILTVRATPQPYDPHGKIAVLTWEDHDWQIAFESPNPQPHESYGGATTLAGNWWFDFDQVADIDGDGGDDLLFQQRWSNITSRSISIAKLLTVRDGELQVLLVEDDFDDHAPTYVVDGATIYSQSHFGQGIAITRTLRLEGERFVLQSQSVNPNAATHSLTLPDGTQFVAFDRECGSLCFHQYGLYRIRDGEQFHFATPIRIHTLQQLRDGNVYIGGDALLRVNGDRLEPANFAPIPRDEIWQIVDMAMTSDGDIWAAGRFKLLHYGKEQSELYDLLTHRVWVSADNSVWAAGWDGRAESGCCVFHVQDGEVTTYLLAEVSAEIAAQLDIEQ